MIGPKLSMRAILIGLTTSMLSFSGCGSAPSPAGPDGRNCYVAQLTPKMLEALAAYHLNVRVGDLIITKTCAANNINETVDLIRLLNQEELR